jgi:hypothetical protein
MFCIMGIQGMKVMMMRKRGEIRHIRRKKLTHNTLLIFSLLYRKTGYSRDTPLSEITGHPIIDHPAYSDMLGRFRDLRQACKCLKVRAVDSPREETGSKDEWMAEEIHKLSTGGSVLVLVGYLHALKRVRWTNGKDNPYLAERLVRQGTSVVSVLQEWDPDCQVREGRLLGARHPRAVAALQSTLDILAVHPLERPEEG